MTSRERSGFIGKERDNETGLGDFGVRKYDFLAGRFTSPDPLWEKYVSLTPYQYSLNNPVNMIDNDGLAVFSMSLTVRVDLFGYSTSWSASIYFDRNGTASGTSTSEGVAMGSGVTAGIGIGITPVGDIVPQKNAIGKQVGVFEATGLEGAGTDVNYDPSITESKDILDAGSKINIDPTFGKASIGIGYGAAIHYETTKTNVGRVKTYSELVKQLTKVSDPLGLMKKLETENKGNNKQQTLQTENEPQMSPAKVKEE